jgi:GDP-4-dehydro-6-deoxy-D-mannose reductase
MKKILITGASGFAGTHLCEYLLTQKQFEIYGTYLLEESVQKSPVKEKIQFKKIDLVDKQQTTNLIREIKPDALIHLAAASSPNQSFKDPAATFIANVTSQINILEAMRENNLTNTNTLIISSGDIYGSVQPEELPVNEKSPLRPTSPYAVSKITQDYLGLQYFLTYNLQCVRVRPFNHIGPAQSPGFVVSDFSKQIAEIEKDKKEPVIYVGNLNAKRDFTDVRDTIQAYYLLLQKGIPGEPYNIGSGKSHSAKEILDILLKLSTTKITIKQDPQKLRPIDTPDITCDSTKLNKLTGWKPKIPLEKTLQDTLDYWRSIV